MSEEQIQNLKDKLSETIDSLKAKIEEIDPKEVQEKAELKKAPDDEKGGFKDAGLLEPTRYGDWDVKGRCSDF